MPTTSLPKSTTTVSSFASRSLSLAEARKKSELIAREIRHRLTGERNDAFTVCAQVEEVELDEAEAGDADLVKVLVTRLDRVRAKRQSDTALKVSRVAGQRLVAPLPAAEPDAVADPADVGSDRREGHPLHIAVSSAAKTGS